MTKMAPFGHSNTNNNKSLPLVEFAQNNWLVWLFAINPFFAISLVHSNLLYVVDSEMRGILSQGYLFCVCMVAYSECAEF